MQWAKRAARQPQKVRSEPVQADVGGQADKEVLGQYVEEVDLAATMLRASGGAGLLKVGDERLVEAPGLVDRTVSYPL